MNKEDTYPNAPDRSIILTCTEKKKAFKALLQIRSLCGDAVFRQAGRQKEMPFLIKQKPNTTLLANLLVLSFHYLCFPEARKGNFVIKLFRPVWEVRTKNGQQSKPTHSIQKTLPLAECVTKSPVPPCSIQISKTFWHIKNENTFLHLPSTVPQDVASSFQDSFPATHSHRLQGVLLAENLFEPHRIQMAFYDQQQHLSQMQVVPVREVSQDRRLHPAGPMPINPCLQKDSKQTLLYFPAIQLFCHSYF